MTKLSNLILKYPSALLFSPKGQIMASWRGEYLQALQDRDEREKASYQRVDVELIEACMYTFGE